MDKDRHVIHDQGFDIFERASYGKGCEVQPDSHEHDHKHPKREFLNFYEESFADLLFFSLLPWLWISS